MATPRQYAVREVALCTFYNITTGNPIVFLENLKTSGVENTGETVYSRGGRGNPKIVGFSGNREGKITLQDAVFTMAMLTGNNIVTGAQNVYKRETLIVASGLTVTLTKTPVGDPIRVAELNTDGGDGTVYVKDTVLGAGKYTIAGKVVTFNTGDVIVGDKIIVYYKMATDATASRMLVTSDNFAGSFKVVLDCLVRDVLTKQDFAAQIIVHNAKMEDNWNFSFSADGDPSVLDIPLEILKPAVGTEMWEMVVFDNSLAL